MTMDCEEFKRRLLTDPMDPDPAFRDHARECPPCATEAGRALAFEAELRRALAAETGEPLPEASGARHGRRWLLLVGLLPLLAALVWWGLHLAPVPTGMATARALAGLAVEHVRSEPDLLDTAARAAVPVPAARLVLGNLGVETMPRLGAGPTLRYAGRCRMGEADGAHLVMDGERGAVTVLVMPIVASTVPMLVRRDGLRALLLPHGHGAVALVGQPGEPLRPLAERLDLVEAADPAPLRP
ncbi:DUF3379 family protein [uncultured Thiohalocapsa sp.]|uniref:DUF3379 family protein n=1 Tax=uncultured Thiohalocapsa sp. TaxID=768990 RepID=UPI0025FF06E7|nr:DUF3379 family protein [uncultured Thiohalocapsa sp.]